MLNAVMFICVWQIQLTCTAGPVLLIKALSNRPVFFSSKQTEQEKTDCHPTYTKSIR